MVNRTEGSDSLVRSISRVECCIVPGGARGDGGDIEDQQHGGRRTMIRAYRLYAGSDGNSHVVRGSVSGGKFVEAESSLFKETPAHSSLDWHDAPTTQHVITLAGVLEFTTVSGETFAIHPGEVLVA